MVNSASTAISIAKKWKNSPSSRPFNFRRTCLMITRTALGIPARYPTAISAWNHAKRRHKFNGNYNSVPAGVAFFWSGPSYAGHVVLTLGGGLCLTNDLAGPGTYTVAKLSDITRRWGAIPKGWTEDLNGVVYYNPPKKTPVRKAKKMVVKYDDYRKGISAKKRTAAQTLAVRRVTNALENRSGEDLGETGAWGGKAQRVAKWWQGKLNKPRTGNLSRYEMKRLGSSPQVKSKYHYKTV